MMNSFQRYFTTAYDPLKAGSIDGTDEYPHDKAIYRAMHTKYKPNKKNIKGDPDCTVFAAQLNPQTTEDTLRKTFSAFGKVIDVTLVRDIVTGFSKCYAFIEFGSVQCAREVINSRSPIVVDEFSVFVDSEKERLLKGWVPRRLGGGLGGKRESGQLRFGGKGRPFSLPILKTDKEDNHQRRARHSPEFRRYSGRRSRSRSRERYLHKSKERRKREK